MPIAIDGTPATTSNTGAGVNNQTVTLTTTFGSDIIVVVANAAGTHHISTISDTAGLSWTARKAILGASHSLDYWTATSANALTADPILVTLASAPVAGWDVVAFGVSGGNTSARFDSSPDLPDSSTFGGTTVSTLNANDMLIGLLITSDGTPAGWTQIFEDATRLLKVMYQVVSTTQSGTVVDSLNNISSASIGDALQAAATAAGIVPWPFFDNAMTAA